MTDNIIEHEFSKPRSELLVGPFKYYRVRVDGRFVPHLTGWKDNDGYWLVVDERFCCGPFPDEETAYQAALIGAQMGAICSGYAHFSALEKGRPYAPQAMEIAP